jgi:small subunit ribosomal protein S6
MIKYETLMLARTEITDDEINALERQMDKIISGKKGKMTLFDRWGKYKLAYPVKKSLYGVYLLARYQVPSESVESLFEGVDTLFRIRYNEIVMRHVTIRLDEDVSSVYKYPEPIGSRGTSNLDSFIKENKMKGLIDTPVKKDSSEKSGPVQEEKAEQSVESPAVEKVSEDTSVETAEESAPNTESEEG